MAGNPTDFDLGPLTWVKTEIDHSLNQARENLDKLVAQPADRAPVKYILTHLHQATGALAMVGPGRGHALQRGAGEAGRLPRGRATRRSCRRPSPRRRRASRRFPRTSTRCSPGSPTSRCACWRRYLELNRARGATDANEGDLFFPNLAAPLPAPAPARRSTMRCSPRRSRTSARRTSRGCSRC